MTGPELTVQKSDKDMIYTCNFSNPVSWEVENVSVSKMDAVVGGQPTVNEIGLFKCTWVCLDFYTVDVFSTFDCR